MAKKKPTITKEDAALAAKKKRAAAKKKRAAKKKVATKKVATKKVATKKVATKKVATKKITTTKAGKDAAKMAKKKATKKIAKKIGWAAARRVAGTALATATGPVGWAALGAYTAYELGKMAGVGGKKPKPTPTPKKVKVIERNKPTGGGSIGRTSMKDFKPKSKVETTKKKSTTSRYDPRKANRAGRKFGQRKAGGIIKKMKGGGRIKYI